MSSGLGLSDDDGGIGCRYRSICCGTKSEWHGIIIVNVLSLSFLFLFHEGLVPGLVKNSGRLLVSLWKLPLENIKNKTTDT